MRPRPLISVIVPVYNVESYLRATLDSVIKQSIGFKQNIELIIVNDGSPDKSEEIILSYKNRYPGNIIYRKQKNGGVSVARNEGMKLSTGKYIHFMDSDDIISRNFYKKSIGLLESNRGRIDLVTSKIKYFGAAYWGHYLNEKYKSAPRIIDCNKESEHSLYHVATSIFLRSSLKGVEFDTNLPYTEDAKFLSRVLARKKKYGIVGGTTYYYRRRIEASSALDTKLFNEKYFTFTLKNAYRSILESWKIDGKYHKYAQNLVINDLQWRIRFETSDIDTCLSARQVKEYKQYVYGLIADIDDEIIINNGMLDGAHKRFLLEKKYGKSVYESNLSIRDGVYYFKDVKLSFLSERFGMRVETIRLVDKTRRTYRLEGFIMGCGVSGKDRFVIKTHNGEFVLNIRKTGARNGNFLGDPFPGGNYFTVDVALQEHDELRAMLETANGSKLTGRLLTGKNSGLGELNRTYTVIDGSLFRKFGNDRIDIRPYAKATKALYEIRFSLQILRNLRIKDAVGSIKYILGSAIHLMPIRGIIVGLVKPMLLVIRSIAVGFISIFIRTIFHFGLFKSDKPIWIVSDRGVSGGDNGEALFAYLVKNATDDVEIYFAISKKSPDYKRIKSIGPVLNMKSLRYKIVHLRSSLVISSSADDNVQRPFPRYMWQHIAGLHNYKFVFLQHGVINGDLSNWLNKPNQNISLFVTTAETERLSILEGDYFYTEDEVVLTGQPRYDLLKDDPQNYVVFTPTWRINLLDETRANVGGVRKYSSDFKLSEYFVFYNRLINDPRIISSLETAKLKGRFYIHPAFSKQSVDFDSNDIISVESIPYNYRDIVNQAALMVTDYSSVAFDFAYLKKPVLYAQFDKRDFYKKHIAKESSFFRYEDNGFGPVSYNYEDTVKAIIETIEGGNKMPDLYRKRSQLFFKYFDSKNTERVYKEISRLTRS